MTVKKFFIGRESETAELESLLSFEQADLVAIIGRRRIGKTYLVKNVFKNEFAFHVTGIKINRGQVLPLSHYVSNISNKSSKH